MKFILSVEKRSELAKAIKTSIEIKIDDTIVIRASTLEEAKTLLESGTYNFQLAVSDLHIPDAENGEIIDLLNTYNVPVFVFCTTMDDDLPEERLSKSAIDYVLNENSTSITTLVKMISRYFKNADTKILYVDANRTAQQFLKNMLKRYNFDLLTASDGYEALDILQDNLDVSLVITNFAMPKMDGLTLTKEIRRTHPDWNIGVIGIAKETEQNISVKFLKSGGNDLIQKNLHREELFCRIHQNLNLIERTDELHNIAAHDYLTNLPNRRTFFTIGEKLIENAVRQDLSAVVAMMDIDFFKNINDTWGHNIGDKVLKSVANKMSNLCRVSDIVARISGAKFAFVGIDINAAQARKTLDAFRSTVEDIIINELDEEIKPTISIGFAPLGMSNNFGENFNALIHFADEALYQAKENGHNRIEKYSEQKMSRVSHG